MFHKEESSSEFYQQMVSYQELLNNAYSLDRQKAALKNIIDCFQANSQSSRATINLLETILFAPHGNANKYIYKPADKFLIMQIASLYISLGNVDQAIETYKLITPLHDEDNNDVCLKIASCYRRLRKPLKVKKILQLAYKHPVRGANSIELPEEIKNIVKQLIEKAKGIYFFVGGFVIRMLIQKYGFDIQLSPSQDIDLTSTATKKQIQTKNYGVYTTKFIEGKFNNLLIAIWEIEEQSYQTDINCSLSDQKNVFNGLDAVKRDFTICSLYISINASLEMQILDPLGVGLKHLQAMRLESIGDASEEFKKDPMRVIRAIKYIALGFIPSDEIVKALSEFKFDHTIDNALFSRVIKEYDVMTIADYLDIQAKNEKCEKCAAHLQLFKTYNLNEKIIAESRRRTELLDTTATPTAVTQVSAHPDTVKVLEFYRSKYKVIVEKPVQTHLPEVKKTTTSLIQKKLEETPKKNIKLLPEKKEKTEKKEKVEKTEKKEKIEKVEKKKTPVVIKLKQPIKPKNPSNPGKSVNKNDSEFDAMLSTFAKSHENITPWDIFSKTIDKELNTYLKSDNAVHHIQTTLETLISYQKNMDEKTFAATKKTIFSKIEVYEKTKYTNRQNHLLGNNPQLKDIVKRAYDNFDKICQFKSTPHYYTNAKEAINLFEEILKVIPTHFYSLLFSNHIYHNASRNLIDDQGNVKTTDQELYKELRHKLLIGTDQLLKVAPWYPQAHYFKAILHKDNDDLAKAHLHIDLAVECVYFNVEDSDIIKEYQTSLRKEFPPKEQAVQAITLKR